MSTYNLPGEHQVRGAHCGRRPTCRPGIPQPSRDTVPSKETHLPKAAFRSARISAPILLALGAMNAWTAQMKADYAALSTALCLCVCAAGLFGEDLVQRGRRQDLVVLAHVAAHPGAGARDIARAVGISERVLVRNLGRLTEYGLVVLVEDDEHAALRSYRLTS